MKPYLVESIQVCSLMHAGYVMLLLFRMIIRAQGGSVQNPHINVILLVQHFNFQPGRGTGHLRCFIRPHSLVIISHHIFTHIHRPINLKLVNLEKIIMWAISWKTYIVTFRYSILKGKKSFLCNQSVLLLTNLSNNIVLKTLPQKNNLLFGYHVTWTKLTQCWLKLCNINLK